MGRVMDILREWLRALGVLLRRNVRLVIAMVALVFVAWVLVELGEGELISIDMWAHETIGGSMRAEWLTPIMESITNIATPVVLAVIWICTAAFAPGRLVGSAMLANTAGALLVNQALKAIVQRPRPEWLHLVDVSNYSFPSGHSMVAMAFFGFMVYLIWKYERDPKQKWAWSACLCVLIVAIGVSRIYLGVHYATDVIAGFLVSLAWLAFFTKVVCPLMLPPKYEDLGSASLKDMEERHFPVD